MEYSYYPNHKSGASNCGFLFNHYIQYMIIMGWDMVLICQTARPDSDHSPSNPLETILRSSLRLGSAMENTTANTNTQKHPETRQLQQQHGCKVSQRRGLQMSFDAGKPGRISINIYIYISCSQIPACMRLSRAGQPELLRLWFPPLLLHQQYQVHTKYATARHLFL